MITKEKIVSHLDHSTEESPSHLIEISVIVPVVEKYDNLEKLYTSYSKELKKLTEKFEFIFVIDGNMGDAYKEIRKFSHNYPEIRILRFLKPLGEAMALSAGFEKARGKYIFTLSSYFQVQPEEIKNLYDALINNECDIVISRRIRKGDSFFNRFQSFIFHVILKLFTGTDFKDISCGLRGMKREVKGAFDIYGDLHLFIPIIAEHHGLTVKEINVKQQKEDTKLRVHNLRIYVNRLIDIITIFFLIRFTYKPLRFFGIIGSLLINSGVLIIFYLVYHRISSEGFALSDKPSLYLASLLLVIGIQVFAIGLIGEIIIYTHGKRAKRFNVKEILE
jgi:glycosyltransferase involved in cell wall biosynthesis